MTPPAPPDAERDGEPDPLEQRILDNPELVARILESAENLGEPMTADEFIEWLHNGMPEDRG